MKIKKLLVTLFLCCSLGLASASMSGCSVGGQIGGVGAGAGIG
jgi:hypothetical protein